MFNYLIGRNRHALELGAGATLLNVNGEYDFGTEEGSFRGFTPIPTANIGYRFQALGNGFTGRFNLSPLFSEGFGVWFGLSVGVTFK